jgi:branched-chain amino acid transport system substrate-binding protein
MKAKGTLIGIVCLLILAFGLIVHPVGAEAGSKKMTIGCIVPITNFPPGNSWARGYSLFEDKINEQGGIKIGNDTYKLKVIVEDSKASAAIAATAAKKLVYKDGARYVYSEIWESCAQAIYDVTSRAPDKVLNILAWINIPGHPADVSANKPLLVRFSPSLDMVQVPDYKWVSKNYPEAKTVVVTGPVNYADMIKKNSPVIENLGFKIIGVELWPLEMYQLAEFVPVCTKIVAHKPDIVHIWCTGMAGNQLKSLREMGFKGPVVQDSPLGSEVVLRIAGPAAARDIINNGVDATNPTPAMAEVRDRWLAKYKEEWVSDSVMAWDNLWVLLQVMQKAQSVDPEKVAAAVETMTKRGDIQTTFGPAYMGGQKKFGVNKVLVRPIPMVSIDEGKLNVVDYYLPEPGQE